MAPPPPFTLDSRAVSGITGSISISCWIIVFTPQLYENFRRQSADGLSLMFVILWLSGDILNVAGSILQGVLPTMITLAFYYAIADLILLLQILMYNRKNALSQKVDPSHLSPATPLLESFEDEEDDDDDDNNTNSQENSFFNPHHHHHHHQNKQTHGTFDIEQNITSPSTSTNNRPTSISSTSEEKPPMPFYKTILINTLMVTGVVIAGIAGWAFSQLRHSSPPPSGPPSEPEPPLEFDFWGQVFGWGCAALYLGSRVPQILLNFERKSVEGISFLFFLFACLGNLTYVISILALNTSWKYILINGSWLAGSFGTLLLDFIIFAQFWIYNRNENEEDEDDEDEEEF
ncbi:uncharacterized protein SAPINGB_P005821 [Magnusiomyces paraingens]|uniref:Uncharacterized protein n=1 Tax=Magnusiomyces paraingens TaxID=2606893 RepID=A0A5E8C3U1_9ASCO|nr:uncharacterized protein SAPINGB_P005821 [Saprochaete ingens]VVT57690.1 unnamed protein product [Saprochaete ingens]